MTDPTVAPRRRYVCARCDAQFTGPDVERIPGKVVVCEPCFQEIEADA